MAEKETLMWPQFWERRQKFITDSLQIAKKYGIDIRSQAYPMFASELGEILRKEAQKHYRLGRDC